MKNLSPIFSFLLGSAVTAIGFLVFAPPSSIDLGIELGRKLGLAAAEKRYAEYERGHASLKVEAEAADKRTEASESSLKAFRASSVKEVKRLKKIEQEAIFAQKQASQERLAIKDTEDDSWETLESATASSNQFTQDAVEYAKIASQAIYNNCMVRLRAANQEGGSLRLQFDLKGQEVVALSASLGSWKALAGSEKKLRQDAEAYISDVKDSGFYFGVGAIAGVVKPLNGDAGPGFGVGLSVGWRF